MTLALRTANTEYDKLTRAELLERLQRSEARCVDLYDHSPVGYVTLDHRGMIHGVNRIASDVIGQDGSPLVGRALAGFVAPEHRVRLARHLDAIFQGSGRAAVELKLVTRRGGVGFARLESVRALEGPGGTKSCRSVVVDITAVRRERDALRKERDCTAATLESARILVVVQDRDGHVVRFNGICESVTGYSSKEVKGKSLWDLRLFPGSVESEKAFFEALLVSGVACRREGNWLTRTGERKRIASCTTPLADVDGQIMYVITTGIDVTEQRYVESALQDRERQLGLLADSLSILISYVDTQQRYRFNNRAYEEWLGRPRSEIEGRYVREVWGDAVYQSISEHIETALAGREVSFDNTVPTQAGGVRYVNATYTPHFDERGSVKGFIALTKDITDRKRLEEQERERRAELARISRLNIMGEMASALAHELNQPLSAIGSFAHAALQMLRSGTGDAAEITDALQAIANQVERSGRVIRGIRRFVRKEEPQRIPVDINAIVREAVGLAASKARRADVVVELDLSDGLPTVVADRVQIEQVVLNLLNNGVEAIESGGGQQRVLIASSSATGTDCVQVSICDSGPGVAPAIMDRIFDPFVTTKPSGLGFGLSISQSIIEAHGGRLWWEQSALGGTMLRFTLPANHEVVYDENGSHGIHR